MHQYIQDTKYAAKGLVELIGRDLGNLHDLQAEQRRALEREAAFDMAFIQREMSPTANYWYGRAMGAQKERMELDDRISFLHAQTMDLKQSLAALSGALLQIAKQGISSIWGRPDNCPNGRVVHGQSLKWIIWAARNQALHYEEANKIDEMTANIFYELNSNAGKAIIADPRAGVSLAHEVTAMLGWSTYVQYERDMVQLLG